jgi:membrane protein implicated in regulation of membrane protease activity
MEDSALISPTSLLLAVLGGNLSLVISSLGPVLGFALQILSLISLVLIIIVNWRKIFKPSEKPISDED